MKWLKTIIAILVLGLSSCDGQYEFSTYPCYFVFNQTQHSQSAILASAMTPNSGVFVTIRIDNNYFYFKDNQDNKEEKIAFNAIDAKLTFNIGMNNAIIVGYGNNLDNTMCAYDRECPNCFDSNAIPVNSYPLSISSNGIATCNRCKRQYNLNNYGIVISGDNGKKLTRYQCCTTGPYGVLIVN